MAFSRRFSVDLEIFLKIFFSPTFLTLKKFIRPLLVRVREGVGVGVRFILNITTAVRIANRTRRTVPVGSTNSHGVILN